MFSILNRALSRIITSFGNKFCLKKRSRLIKALDNRFCIKFMQLEIGLLTASISFHDFKQYMSGRCIIGFFSLRMKTLDCQKQNVNKYVPTPCRSNKCIKKGVLCALDSLKVSKHGTRNRGRYQVAQS